MEANEQDFPDWVAAAIRRIAEDDQKELARRRAMQRSKVIEDRRLTKTALIDAELASYYSPIGRSSIDPVLMIRMLVIGCVFAIRSERLLCHRVQVNVAYRWFCGLSIEDKIPDHSTFSRARNEGKTGHLRVRDHRLKMRSKKQTHGYRRRWLFDRGVL